LEFNNIKTYIAIAIVGCVVGILYLAIQRNLPIALIFFYVTLYLVVTLRYFLERRHYKKHKAVTASTQFLLLPFSILLMGNFISPLENNPRIFIINIDLAGGDSIGIFFNLISVSLLFPVIILSLNFNNYFSGKWPAMAVNRKVRRGRTIPFLLNTAFVSVLLLGFFINWQMDFLSLIFVLIYIIMFFRYFIFASTIESRRQVSRTTTTRSTRRTPSRAAASRQQTRTSRASSARSTSSRGSQRSRSTQTRRRAPTTTSASARIDPGRDVSTTRRTVTRSTARKLKDKDIFPAGVPSKEDMKCIICYMDFKKNDTRRIVLCPHCRYPAHEDEFMSWFQKSKLCARCNKPITVRYARRPLYRVSTKVYIERVIEKI